MRRIAVISLAVVLMLVPLVGVSCGSDGNGESSSEDIGITALPEGYTWHQNDEFGYEIAYPENWTAVPQETVVLDEGMDHAQNFNHPDSFGSIMIIVASEYDLNQLKARGSSEVLINGRNGHQVIFDFSLGAGGQTVIIKYDMAAFVVNDKYYVVSCTTSEELWEEYASTFENVIRSFVIE